MALEPGSTFAGYVIERRLGVGGMGAVYLAKHPRLPRRDAVKILDAGLGADNAFRARFEREAELTSRLDHPNIVTIHDRGLEGDRLWISMRYVDGADASQLIAQNPHGLPVARALDIVADAARGLDYAHRHGLLHRDVKPANLLIASSEDGDHVFVTDFGIARTLDDTTALTSTGSFLATIAYAAPELIEGKSIDHRIDVYALGCTLYEMLTGRVPFERSNPVAVMHAHLSAAPPLASQRNPNVPPALDVVIARAMAKDPADRFQTCREFAAAARAATDVSSRNQVAPPPPAPPTVVRHTAPPAFTKQPNPTPPPQRYSPTPPPHQQVPPRPYTDPGRPAMPQHFATGTATANRRTGIGTGAIVAGVVALLVVAVLVVAGIAIARNGDGGSVKAGTFDTPTQSSDEEAIDYAIRNTYSTLVDEGIDAALPLFCEDSQSLLELAVEAGAFDPFVVGDFAIEVESVENIEIDGDSATADSTTTTSGLGDGLDGTETSNETLVRENGDWKLCWEL